MKEGNDVELLEKGSAAQDESTPYSAMRTSRGANDQVPTPTPPVSVMTVMS